jgi:hypothetical protein
MGKLPLLKMHLFISASARRFRAIALAFLALGFLTIGIPAAMAVEMATLYTAQVALDDEQDNPRQQAYKDALATVLLRVSGAELGSDPEMIELLFPSPAAYVVQFRPGEDDTLWVSFDGEAVEQVLRQSGQTVWGTDRPVTLIWLAVDWGQGEREIIAADDPEQSRSAGRTIDRDRLLRQRVLDMAERRGLPVLFPLMDAQDQQSVQFSDIWGGFDELVLAASERYEVSSILIGRVRASSSQRNRWDYIFSGDKRTWNGEPEMVVGLVADQLANEFAIRGDAPVEFVDLLVSGINSVEIYAEMQNILDEANVIEGFSIAEVSGDLIRYRVEVLGGIERLRRALRFSGLIEQNSFDGAQFPVETLEFFYSEE